MDLVKPGSSPYFRLLLYGAPGVGKSLFSTDSGRKTRVIDLEGGTMSVPKDADVLCTPMIKTQKGVEEAIRYFRKDAPEVLVLDSVSMLQDMLINELTAGADQTTLQKFGVAGRRASMIVHELCQMPCHVILLAREIQIMDDSGLVTAVKADLTPFVSRRVQHYVDFVWRLASLGSKRELTFDGSNKVQCKTRGGIEFLAEVSKLKKLADVINVFERCNASEPKVQG